MLMLLAIVDIKGELCPGHHGQTILQNKRAWTRKSTVSGALNLIRGCLG